MIDWRGAAHTQLTRKQKMPPLSRAICVFFMDCSPRLPSDTLGVCVFSTFKAWLTEIHEYAQKDVVVMLLGNKVSKASLFCIKR